MAYMFKPADLESKPFIIDNAAKSHIDQWRRERQICPDYKLGRCTKDPSACKYRHGTKSDVCTHWMRGLCKLNARCEFLHVYDMNKMPLCHFFQTFGTCKEGDNCQFRHTRQHQAKYECLAYRAGFCKQGPNCKALHVRRELCLQYFAGFCPKGPDCDKGHPQFNEHHIETGEWPTLAASKPIAAPLSKQPEPNESQSTKQHQQLQNQFQSQQHYNPHQQQQQQQQQPNQQPNQQYYQQNHQQPYQQNRPQYQNKSNQNQPTGRRQQSEV